jgi:ribonuclease HI
VKIIVYADGGSRGNPGPAGCGAFLADPSGKPLCSLSRFLGKTTNNVAEYSGAIMGIAKALELGAGEIELRSDSELLIKQLKGEYRVKNEKLKPLYAKLKSLLPPLFRIQFKHIPREQNCKADSLANAAMDSGK